MPDPDQLPDDPAGKTDAEQDSATTAHEARDEDAPRGNVHSRPDREEPPHAAPPPHPH